MPTSLVTRSMTGHSCNTKQKCGRSDPLPPLCRELSPRSPSDPLLVLQIPGGKALHGVGQQPGCCKGPGGSGASWS